MSWRRRSGSTGGRLERRRTSSRTSTRAEATGRSSATGLPFRVTVRRSPRATRSTTSPPWFLSSRIDTSGIGSSVSRVIPEYLKAGACAEFALSNWAFAAGPRPVIPRVGVLAVLARIPRGTPRIRERHAYSVHGPAVGLSQCRPDCSHHGTQCGERDPPAFPFRALVAGRVKCACRSG